MTFRLKPKPKYLCHTVIRMSRSESPGDDRITIRCTTAKKQRIKMRVAQLGYDTVTDYLHDRIDDDLEDADLPEIV